MTGKVSEMKAVVLGAVSFDRYVIVNDFPEEDSMVFAEEALLFPGGSGANMAINLAGFGAETYFFCGTGKDIQGRKLISTVENKGVRVYCDRQAGRSAETLIIVNKKGMRRIISFGGNALYSKNPDKTIDPEIICIADSFPDIALDFISCYEKCRKIYVPGGCGLYFGVENIRRIAEMTEITILSAPEANAIGTCFERISETVIVTRGKEPTDIYKKGRCRSIPVNHIEGKIIDTTGAGDAFASGFAFELATSGNLESAVATGHKKASEVITRYGASLGV